MKELGYNGGQLTYWLDGAVVIWNAWGLISVGVVLLVIAIPLLGKISDQRSRTDFLSARAAYWCIISGTILLLLRALDTCIVDAVALLKR